MTEIARLKPSTRRLQLALLAAVLSGVCAYAINAAVGSHAGFTGYLVTSGFVFTLVMSGHWREDQHAP
jgi:uncharacterized membrane protein YwaF